MKLTFMTDIGQLFDVEIDPQMELENIMALLEAESGVPINEQSISYEGRDLNNPKTTMASYGVQEGSTLLLRRKLTVAGRTVEQDPEMMRYQILGDPNLMAELRASHPELAAAAQSDPARFAVLLRQTQERQRAAAQQEQQLINSNPYDVEAQKRIEEAIRQQAVFENMQHALEYSPESFGRVTMLYINVEVNSVPVQAFVDSGAQQTIMSPECAEKCGIMRLLDGRFSGIARGVGTAKILGRVHSAQLKVADLHLACAITVMEGRSVDLLFGLDMLKAYQACIDLDKNVLRIRGREVPFLPEHELPPEARGLFEDAEDPQSSTPNAPSAESSRQPSFPGAGHALGTSPSSSSRATNPPQNPSRSRYPEKDIQTLVGLGATREIAIQALDTAGGNVEIAASVLFSF